MVIVIWAIVLMEFVVMVIVKVPVIVAMLQVLLGRV